MTDETTYVGIRGEWQDLIEPLAAKLPGLEHIEPFRAKLETTLGRTTELTAQQSALSSKRQVISKELRQLIFKGQRLAAVIRKALKEYYGPDAEELTTFKLQPFRGRKLSAEALASRRAKRAKKTPAPDAEAATPAAEPSDR
jgi:hypothetical protein